ncbi:hypothetical protein M3G15_21065, partial [Paenibacillus sp. p3-SID1389]|uniref:hypothetical protein n=1 Tax=Paenibacillus sp. p3-SID1389 TaxID=2916364 RepID=UPI0021A57A3B
FHFVAVLCFSSDLYNISCLPRLSQEVFLKNLSASADFSFKTSLPFLGARYNLSYPRWARQ